jgi:hypothetical protein
VLKEEKNVYTKELVINLDSSLEEIVNKKFQKTMYNFLAKVLGLRLFSFIVNAFND